MVIDGYRDEMRTWLPFVDYTLVPEDSIRFAGKSENSCEEIFAILCDGRFAGIIGFKNTDLANRRSEIGYWLSPEYQKRGIMTRCVRRLCSYAFEEIGLHRLTVKCAVENVPSRLIPIKLGFNLEGIEKDGELLSGGRYADIEVYAKVNSDK